jgi:hypothetical protein
MSVQGPSKPKSKPAAKRSANRSKGSSSAKRSTPLPSNKQATAKKNNSGITRNGNSAATATKKATENKAANGTTGARLEPKETVELTSRREEKTERSQKTVNDVQTLTKGLEENFSLDTTQGTEQQEKSPADVDKAKTDLTQAKSETATELKALESQQTQQDAATSEPNPSTDSATTSKSDSTDSKAQQADEAEKDRVAEQNKRIEDTQQRQQDLEKTEQKLQATEQKKEAAQSKENDTSKKPSDSTTRGLQLLTLNGTPGSTHDANSFEGKIEAAGFKGPITADQAAEFTRQLQAQEPPTDPAKRAEFDQKQQAARNLIAEAQTPLMGQRLGLQAESQTLNQSLQDYGQVQGIGAAGNFANLEQTIRGGQPATSILAPDPSTQLSYGERSNYGAVNEEMTAGMREDLRNGTLSKQLFQKDFQQVQSPSDAKTMVKTDQASAQNQQQTFPNFSQSLEGLEAREAQLNQAYQDAGLEQRSNSEALNGVRSNMEAADKYLANQGRVVSQTLGLPTEGRDAFADRPVTGPESGAGGPKPLSDAAKQELQTFQDLRSRGIAPGDIQMSPELSQQLGVAPRQLPNQMPNPFASQNADAPRLSGDMRGADLAQANLQNYNTNGEIYDKETKFPPGYSTQANQNVRQLDATEDYQTHLGVQPEGLQRQHSTRVLEQNGQFPNPDYRADDPNSSATVDANTFHERYTQRQIAQTERSFAQERSYVQEAGGYDQAIQSLRDQAKEKYPSSGRTPNSDKREAEFQRLVQEHMPNHYAAQQQALQSLRAEAVVNTTDALGERPPTTRPSSPPPRTPESGKQAYQEKKDKYDAYNGELQKLKADKLEDMRANNLSEAQREEIQSAANIDRDELDREWANIGDAKLHQEANGAWENLSTEERRGAMTQIAAERIEMAQYDSDNLYRSGLENSPEDARKLQGYHQESREELTGLREKLAAGNVEEVDALLRQGVLEGSPRISNNELMDNYAAPEDRPEARTFEQKTADMQAQKEAAYQQNGWWEDSPFAGRDNGAFMQDLSQRDMLAISPNDAARGLQTLEQMNQSGDLEQGQYDEMRSKLSRSYDLGRVGQGTAALDQRFGQMVDDQGVVGDFANFAKNQFGRPNGWVVDSNLGSDAINGDLAKAYRSREQIMELAHFKGTDAEFRDEYSKRLGNLQEQVKGIDNQMGAFQHSQENWVEGVSDIASVSAGLALAPVTGGASLLAVPAATAATKVGVKALEAGTGNNGYQGNVGTDLLKGGLNGLSALGTSKVAGLAEKAFVAGRAPGAATWLGTRGITALEGAADGFITGTGGSLLDGNSLESSLQQGATSAIAGGVIAPVIRTGVEGVTNLGANGASGVDAPSALDRPTASLDGPKPAADGFSSEPSKLRVDGDQLSTQAAGYLESQGLDPNLLDNTDFHVGTRPDGSSIDTPQTVVGENGHADVYLPADANGRVSAHQAGHEMDHAILAQRAAQGDSQAAAALREAQGNYQHMQELRQQGASMEEIAAAQNTYQNSLAEHRAEAGGHNFVDHQLEQIKATQKPKSGGAQDTDALSRLQEPVRDASAAHQAAADGATPANVDGPTGNTLGRDPEFVSQFDKDYGLKEDGFKLLDDSKLQDDLGAAYAGADEATQEQMRRRINSRIMEETSEARRLASQDPNFNLEDFQAKIPKMKELLDTVGSTSSSWDSHFKLALDDINRGQGVFQKVEAGSAAREASLTEANTQKPRMADAVDPQKNWKDYDPTEEGMLFWKKRPAPPPMVGDQLSVPQAVGVATDMETALLQYGRKADRSVAMLEGNTGAREGLEQVDRNMPKSDNRGSVPVEDLFFSQGGPEGNTVYWTDRGGDPGISNRLGGAQPARNDGAVTFVEFPMPDGTFKYLSLDGHHRIATEMLQGNTNVHGQVYTLDQLGQASSHPADPNAPTLEFVRDRIRRLTGHLWIGQMGAP